MSDNITPIIDDIRERGYLSFEDIVTRKEAEKYFIDFKKTQNSDYSKQRTLYDDDRKNLAKAISGFGNSEGGIIIWGIDASGRIDDYAKSINPIDGVDNFKSILESFVSLLTLPVHNTVESFVVKKSKADKKGIAVTIIPKNNDKPFQDIGDFKYYMRAGNSFVPVPHGVLQGMFGKAPQPNVFLMYNISSKPEIGQDKSMTWQIGLMAVNGGLGIAEDIYGYARVWSPGDSSQIGVELTDTENYKFYKAYGVEFSFMANQGFRLGYDQKSQMMIMNFKLLPPFTKELYVNLLIGGRNQQVYRKTIQKSPKRLNEIYTKCLTNPTMECLKEIWDLKD